MHFYLPPEVEFVEGHMRWLGEVGPYLEPNLLDKFESIEDHIRWLIQSQDEYDDVGAEAVTDENWEQEYNEQNPKFCALYASRMNMATKLGYLGEFDKALDKLELLHLLYDKLEPCHVMAFSYFLDALVWTIKTMKNIKINSLEEKKEEKDKKEENGGSGSSEMVLEQLNTDSVRLDKRWEELKQDPVNKAVHRYLWACLGGSMKVSEDFLLQNFRAVLNFQPDYHLWYAEVYRKMRSIRRNECRQKNNILKEPSEEEQKMCREAWKRNPNTYLSCKDMGMMLKEVLWGRVEQEWDKEVNMYLKCQKYLEQALQIAQDRDQKSWVKKIQVYLAEFLLFGRGKLLDQEKGKWLFDRAVAENPEDSTVLHKVGKLCHFGATARWPGNRGKYQDWNLAEEFYDCALKADAGNFPCLKDYLKLLQYGNSQEHYKKYVTLCDQGLENMKRDHQISDLRILKGLVVWIFNPFEWKDHMVKACQTWLSVLTRQEEYAGKLFKMIKKPPFSIGRGQPRYRKPASINSQDLRNTLCEIRGKVELTDEETLEAIHLFLTKL